MSYCDEPEAKVPRQDEAPFHRHESICIQALNVVLEHGMIPKFSWSSLTLERYMIKLRDAIVIDHTRDLTQTKQQYILDHLMNQFTNNLDYLDQAYMEERRLKLQQLAFPTFISKVCLPLSNNLVHHRLNRLPL